MKIISIIFLLFQSFTAYNQSKYSDEYSLYKTIFLGDSVNIGSGPIWAPIRLCRNQADSEYIYIGDLIGLKFNEYKKYSFKQFDKLVIEKIFRKECFDLKGEYISTDLKFSLEEYNRLNADSLYKRYFSTGEYGSTEDEIPPAREILIALIVLFDNNYYVGLSDVGYLYTIKKAPTNEDIKKWMLNHGKQISDGQR